MKITNKILFTLIVLNIAPVLGMQFGKEKLEILREAIWDYAKAFLPKPKASPEEQRFIMQLKNWTASDSKFATFNSVMRVSLSSPNAKFIKDLMTIIVPKNTKAIATLTGHDGDVSSVSWSPDGNYAISGSFDNTVKLWDLRNKQNPNTQPIATLNDHNFYKGVYSVSWSPDGNYALSGSDDGKINLWDLTNKQNPNTKAVATWTGSKGRVHGIIASVSWSPDGNYAISGSNDGEIRLWDLTNKQKPNTKAIAKLIGHGGLITSVSWSPNGNYAISGSFDKTVKLWDLKDKQNPNTKAIATLTGHTDSVRSVSWSPDGHYALSVSEDDTIKLWDLTNKQNPKAIATLTGHNDWSNLVSWSPDGNYAISDSRNGKIKLWDLRDKQNPKAIATLTGHNNRLVRSLSWSPDGNYALSGSIDDTIKLWNLSFLNLPKQLMKLVDNRDGIKQYLLLSSILEFRKNQEDKKNKLYTSNPQPFRITYLRLKKLFNALPDALTRGLVDKSYVVLG